MSGLLSRYDVKKVVCILAGSRTGSGFLFRALTKQGEFLAPSAEETPYYRKVGIGVFTGSDYSDEITRAPLEPQLDEVGRSLLDDVGVHTGLLTDANDFAETVIARLKLQWPRSFNGGSIAEVRKLLLEKLKDRVGKKEDWSRVYLSVVNLLKARGYPMDEAFYSNGALTEIESLPTPLLEDLPYIIPEPRVRATRDLLKNRPLLLKTNTNIYRIPLLKSLFPKAQFRWIVLSRNPAATIHALSEGWKSGGFHSHRTTPDISLQIYGYSDKIVGGKDFWKFDMPPGWQRYTQKDLTDVCSFQWESAHRQLARFIKSTPDPITCIRYEDLAQPESFRDLLDFSEVDQGTGFDPAVRSPLVFAPEEGDWRVRRKELENVLIQSKTLLATAAEFGYFTNEIDTWI
jgi:hypothetical protein